MNRSINTCFSSQKTGRKLHRKVFEKIIDSSWRTSCKSMSPGNASKSWLCELARILFPVGSTNNNSKNNVLQSYRRWMHLGRNISYKLLLSHSVKFYQVLNVVKMFNREIISHLKRIGAEKHMRIGGFCSY